MEELAEGIWGDTVTVQVLGLQVPATMTALRLVAAPSRGSLVRHWRVRLKRWRVGEPRQEWQRA